MSDRAYRQFCPAARALDVVGERWTLLVVRELLYGPKRYTDLLQGLPGIGPNLLARRLKSLEAEGVVARRDLPPPAASTVYELTELGRGLQPVLETLFRWGLNFMETPAPDDTMRLGWLLGAIRAGVDAEAARGVRESYELRVDGEVLHVMVDDGTVYTGHGPARDPVLIVTSDLATFLAVASRRLDPEQALRAGLATIAGDPGALERSLRILGPLPAAEAALT